MSPASSLPARLIPRWLWLTVGLIIVITLLAVVALPSSKSDDEVGERGPDVRPQSDVRPPPAPSLARARTLAV